MPDTNYLPHRTGLLLVDAYNDLLSEGGKLRPKIGAAGDSLRLIPNLRALIDTGRQLGIGLFYVPHRRWREGDFDGWRYPSPSQLAMDREACFADGTWGADWH